ncbi:uncharacterized protein YvpB [Lactobacillus colini]|uniref:Uncharacterized protein YvpB n=1 Tax=Lactobacillus colini TaxID=1819254 RepID=A0ABS4ME43_9LACO|nr:C39 family peptidase [Lactobacillus colini]MBP2057951.1 uncharacterized protein YvpB [Lactobacillus colini]
MKKISTTLAVALMAAGIFATDNLSVMAAPSTTSSTATSVNKGTKLAKNTYMTVAYKPNKHIHIYKMSKTGKFSRNGSLLENGYSHKIYNQKKNGKSTYYYLGNSKWVNAKNVIKTHIKHTRFNVLKKNANSREYYTSQYFPVFAPWGCASASLSMLMKYDNTFKNIPGANEQQKLTYMQNNLPRNKATGGQDGDPYTGAGFSRVILSYRLTQYAHKLGDKNIRDVSGISMTNLSKLVLSGHPVLYYGYSSYDASGARNHCKVIFGYSTKSNKFLVHDPLYQSKRFYKGGGGRNEYDLGPISWVKASHIAKEFVYPGGNNALTIK